MGIQLQKLSYYDFQFYKQYQEWYYTSHYPNVKYTFNIGDVVKIKHSITPGYEEQIGIVISLSGISNYLYVMAYSKRGERYWVCGFNESDLIKLNKDMAEDESLYLAFENWLLRNDFNLCTDDFRTKYYEYMNDKDNVFTKRKKQENVIYYDFRRKD